MEIIDKNGKPILKGDTVNVPSPTELDNWNHDFTGHVEDIENNGYIIVMDGDGDCFIVEAERLEVDNE